MEECVEQFEVTAATLRVLGMARGLVTGFSHPWTQAWTPSVDELYGYLPHSPHPSSEGSLSVLELFLSYTSNKRGISLTPCTKELSGNVLNLWKCENTGRRLSVNLQHGFGTCSLS